MNAEYLRALASNCAATSEQAARESTALAALLLRPGLGESEREAIEAAVHVQDCMARRHAQWSRAALAAAEDAEA